MDPNIIYESSNGVENGFLSFLIENWLTIIFGIVGFASMVFGYVSWKLGVKQKKIYGYLFALAEKSIDKEETERTLAQRKKEVAKISDRIQSLQEKIREDIPKEARRAVLKDRLNSQVGILKEVYDSILRIKKELGDIGESPEIPPELLKSIEVQISPEYILKEKRSKLKTFLSAIMGSAALSATLLPYEFGRIVAIILLLVGVGFFLFLRIHLLQRSATRRK